MFKTINLKISHPTVKMPYSNLESFIAESGANITRIYDFDSNELYEPAIVTQELADEILEWLERESERMRLFQSNTTQLGQSMSLIKSGIGYQRTFVAPK